MWSDCDIEGQNCCWIYKRTFHLYFIILYNYVYGKKIVKSNENYKCNRFDEINLWPFNEKM